MRNSYVYESYSFHTLFQAEQKVAHNQGLFNRGGNCKLQFPPLLNNPKPSDLQACTHPPKEKRKEIVMREKEREGSTKGKGGLYKMLQIPTLPTK